MQNVFIAINAWREIIARVFEDVTPLQNVSPDWLINPATKRRLKLDLYFPDMGIAFRIVGLMAKGQKRQSDWEALEEEQRNQTRVELCAQNGVQLMLIEPADDALKQIDKLQQILSRASRSLAQGKRPDAFKRDWMPRLATARDRASQLRSLVARNPEQMLANLAEAWRDRESGGVSASPEPLPMPVAVTKSGKPLPLQTFAEGQRVEHERFGPGVVVSVAGEGADATISVLFDASSVEPQQRSFMLGLVQDKLKVIN